MKRKFILILFVLLALLIVGQVVNAVDFSLHISCVDNSQPDRAIIYFGYVSSDTVEGMSYFSPTGSYYTEGAGLSILEAGEHQRAFSLEAYYPGRWDFITLDGVSDGIDYDMTTTGPSCDGWQPGAPSIYIPLTSDCSTVDIKDAYGHWSKVTSDGDPVLLHYGESLIGGQNQSTDPDDYRAVPTACY